MWHVYRAPRSVLSRWHRRCNSLRRERGINRRFGAHQLETFCVSMLTCRKTYTDIPWAHRQHRHDGHCAYLHGHNWSITITFGCREPDENGFVLDFGKLKFLKHWIDE